MRYIQKNAENMRIGKFNGYFKNKTVKVTEHSFAGGQR